MTGIMGTRLYTEAITGWNKKPVVDQTWKNFQKYFADEYHKLKEHQRINTRQARFQSANAATEANK